jgi:ABC-type metal ion transport system substrate-binding protein
MSLTPSYATNGVRSKEDRARKNIEIARCNGYERDSLKHIKAGELDHHGYDLMVVQKQDYILKAFLE